MAREMHLPYFSVNQFARAQGLYKTYDRQFQSFILDISKLKTQLSRLLSSQKKIVVDTTYNTGVVPKNSSIIVLRLDPVLLNRRLIHRKWSKKKRWENVEAELIDSVYIDAVNCVGQRRVFQIDTTHKSKQQVEKMAMKVVNGKVKHREEIDWLNKYDPIDLQRRLRLN